MRDDTNGSSTYDVVVVGGGFAGAMTAVHVVRRDPAARVAVVERDDELGPGVAYATDDPKHLLNVPAAKMGAFADEPGHFLAWLHAAGAATAPNEFVARRTYGAYLRAIVAEAGDRVEHVRGEATSIRPADGGAGEQVGLADGHALAAARVVVALGVQPSQPLDGIPYDDPRVFGSPWQDGALDVPAGSTTLLVGSGLTAVDATLSICGAHDGNRVVAVSRNGQLPFVHLREPLRDHVAPPAWTRPLTADGVARTFREHCRAVEDAGGDWRDVVDAVRGQVPDLWHELGEDEQRIFVRAHMRAWEVRRHRMAPAVADELERLRTDGRFEVRAGSIARVTPGAAALHVELRDGSALPVDRVISCVGPSLDIRRSGSPLVQQLLAEGRAVTDAHHIGLRSDAHGALLTTTGAAQPTLLTLGQLRRGELWETTAVPEIRVQAQRVAERLSPHVDP